MLTTYFETHHALIIKGSKFPKGLADYSLCNNLNTIGILLLTVTQVGYIPTNILLEIRALRAFFRPWPHHPLRGSLSQSHGSGRGTRYEV